MVDNVFAGAPRVAFGASRLGPAASVVRRFVDCVNRRDLAAAAALLADDVLWEDLGEVRTLAVQERWRGSGVGHAIYERLEQQARELGLRRLFCLTFETEFFGRHGFVSIGEELLVDPEVYSELVRSPDEGVAEFLDLSRVKPNTLGNSRLLKEL